MLKHFMLYLVIGGSWILSVVVVNLVLNVSGNLLTSKVQNWFGSTSKKRAKRRIEYLNDRLGYVEYLTKNDRAFFRSMFLCLLSVLSRLALGILLLSGRDIEPSGTLLNTVSEIEKLVGWLSLSSIPLTAALQVSEVRNMSSSSFRHKISQEIKQLEKRYPELKPL